MSLSRSDERDDFSHTDLEFLRDHTNWKGFKITGNNFELKLVSRSSLLTWKCKCLNTLRFFSLSFIFTSKKMEVFFNGRCFQQWQLFDCSGKKVDYNKTIKDFFGRDRVGNVDNERKFKKARKANEINNHQSYYVSPVTTSMFLDTHYKLFLEQFRPGQKIVLKDGSVVSLKEKDSVLMPKTSCGKPIIETESGVVIGRHWFNCCKTIFVNSEDSPSYVETIVTSDSGKQKRFQLNGKDKFEILVTDRNETVFLVDDKFLVYDDKFLEFEKEEHIKNEILVVSLPESCISNKMKKIRLVILSRIFVHFRTTENNQWVIKVCDGVVIGKRFYKRFWSEFHPQTGIQKASHVKHYIVDIGSFVERGKTRVCVWKTECNNFIYILENGSLVFKNRHHEKWAIKDHPLEYLGLSSPMSMNITCLGIHTFTSTSCRTISTLPSLGLFGKKVLLFFSIGYVVLVGIEEGVITRIKLEMDSGREETEFYDKPAIIRTPEKVKAVSVTNYSAGCRYVKHWRDHAVNARSESSDLYVHLVSSDVNYGFCFSKKFVCLGCGDSFENFNSWKTHTDNRISTATSFQRVQWTGPKMSLVSKPLPTVRTTERKIRSGFFCVKRSDVKRGLDSKYVPLL